MEALAKCRSRSSSRHSIPAAARRPLASAHTRHECGAPYHYREHYAVVVKRRIHKKNKPFATPRPQLSRPIPSRPIHVSDGYGSASQPVAKDGEAPWC